MSRAVSYSGRIAPILVPALTPLLVWAALPGRFSLWPLLPFCLVPLLRGLDNAATAWKAVMCGLGVGSLMYLLQIYWIAPVLVRYGGLPWLVAVPAMLLLVFYMSLYTAVFSYAFFLLRTSTKIWVFLLGPASLWVGLDWLRSLLFTGFPWMDLGYGFSSLPLLLQGADLCGHHGFTFLILLSNGVIYCLATRRFSVRQRLGSLFALTVLVILISGYGFLRLHQVTRIVDHADKAVFGVVQGNIDQGLKWSPQATKQNVATHIRLSRALAAERDPALIVWPESALAFYPSNRELLAPVIEFIKTSSVPLLTGSPWYEAARKDKGERFYNGALLLDSTGSLGGLYFKSHLVPYGEYVPLRRYMPFLSPLVEAVGDFTPGTVEKVLRSGTIKAGVLICFESIFPDIGRAWVEKGANVLINLTNDAWYGKSSAPYQSWAMTIYRAVETRRSLVRSANTGISGIIDPCGRIVEKSDIFTQWSAVASVPLLTGTTWFVRGGYLCAPFFGVIGVLILIPALIRAQRMRRVQ